MKNRNLSPFIVIVVLLVIYNLVSGGLEFTKNRLFMDLMMIPGMLVGIAFHEFAHAGMSYLLGDPTPKEQGRVTLNPLAHIDVIGFIALFFAGFGWGKAVQIDPRYYKNRRMGEILVGFSGVVMNFLMAIVFALIIKMIIGINPFIQPGSLLFYTLIVLKEAIYVNLMLMVFNLIPIPPLDGFGIVTAIFDLSKYSWYYNIFRYGPFILMLLIFTNGTRFIMGPALNKLMELMMTIIIS